MECVHWLLLVASLSKFVGTALNFSNTNHRTSLTGHPSQKFKFCKHAAWWFFVTLIEPVGSSAPKFSQEGSGLQLFRLLNHNLALFCPAQSSPPPLFRYLLEHTVVLKTGVCSSAVQEIICQQFPYLWGKTVFAKFTSAKLEASSQNNRAL